MRGGQRIGWPPSPSFVLSKNYDTRVAISLSVIPAVLVPRQDLRLLLGPDLLQAEYIRPNIRDWGKGVVLNARAKTIQVP